MGDKVDVPFILFFEADEDTMIKRITGRSQIEGRNDDNIETLRKRFDTLRDETMPIVDHYEKQGKVRRINALQSIEEVYKDVKKAFEGYI